MTVQLEVANVVYGGLLFDLGAVYPAVTPQGQPGRGNLADLPGSVTPVGQGDQGFEGGATWSLKILRVITLQKITLAGTKAPEYSGRLSN